jgi:hypothetical protein
MRPHLDFCVAAEWQSDRFVVLTDAMKLRKIFRKEAARR